MHPPQVSAPLPFYLLQGSSWELPFPKNEWTIVSPFKNWKKEPLPPGRLQANIRIRGLTSYRLEGKYLSISYRFGAGEGMNCEAGSATTQSNPPPYECWGPGFLEMPVTSPVFGSGLPPVFGSGLPPVFGSGLPPVLGSGLPPVLGLDAHMSPSSSVTLPHARV